MTSLQPDVDPFPAGWSNVASKKRRRYPDGGAKNSRARLSGSRKDRPEP